MKTLQFEFESGASNFAVTMLAEDSVSDFWPQIEVELDRVAHIWANRWTKDFLYNSMMRGAIQTWAGGTTEEFSVIVLTQIAEYPAGRILQMLIALGHGIEALLPLFDATFEKFAAECGCSEIEAVGRDGWKKWASEYGYRRQAVLYSKMVRPLRVM